ncbi:MAG: fused DSP-PTPase phosphatase/NAD kinase-like protein [Bacteroidota bacterium]
MLPFERSYWVLPNRFIVGEIPASMNENETITKLKGLIQVKVNVVINLMEEDEKNYENKLFYDYAPYLNKHNIETHRIPIKDLSIPTIETMRKILSIVQDSIRQKKVVYLHCWGGVGRTGTAVGCFLLNNSLATKENVLETINYLKRTTSIDKRQSPETEEQRRFLMEWPASEESIS